MEKKNKPIIVTLFHSHNCGHCIDFMNYWNEMNRTSGALKNIHFQMYEHSEIQNLSKTEYTVNGQNIIDGYPTIKISVFNKHYVYEGANRQPQTIYNFILEKLRQTIKNM